MAQLHFQTHTLPKASHVAPVYSEDVGQNHTHLRYVSPCMNFPGLRCTQPSRALLFAPADDSSDMKKRDQVGTEATLALSHAALE